MSIVSKLAPILGVLALVVAASSAHAQVTNMQLCTADPNTGRCIAVNGNNPLPITTNSPTAIQTTNNSVVIATGNLFQTIMPASVSRKSLTIINNNSNGDTCWLYLGGGAATKNASIPLVQYAQYIRFSGPIPSDTVQVTCASSADTLYADQQ